MVRVCIYLLPKIYTGVCLCVQASLCISVCVCYVRSYVPVFSMYVCSYLYIYIYIYEDHKISFQTLFRMDTSIDSTHKKL